VIIAKEITKLVESTTQTFSKQEVTENLDKFVSLLDKELAPEHLIVEDVGVNRINLSIITPFPPRSHGSLSCSVSDFLDDFKNQFKVLSSDLTKFLGPISPSGGSRFLTSMYKQTHSSLEVGSYYGGLGMSFVFDTSLLFLDFIFDPEFIESLGSSGFAIFCVNSSTYIRNQVNKGEAESPENQICSGIVKKSQLPIRYVNDGRPNLYLDIPVVSESKESPKERFFKETKDKLELPLSSLKKISRRGDFFKDSGLWFPYYGFFGASSKIMVGLLFHEDGNSSLRKESPVLPGFIRVLCVLSNLNYLIGFYNDDEELDSYIESITESVVDVFIGYKKLVNQFNNKPSKKTNADW